MDSQKHSTEIAAAPLERVRKLAEFIYGKQTGARLAAEIADLLGKYRPRFPRPDADASSPRFSERDAVLITYADQLSGDNGAPLATLHDFARQHFDGLVSTVHFLPFFPYSSDDGFSVIDYRRINPEVGGWEDVEAFRRSFKLMFDAVVNHISAASGWFQGYLTGVERYQDYFIAADPDADYSPVTRPRSLPLLSRFDTAEGEKWLWTTFSDDQIDLNYANPEVALEMLDILLFYVEKGAWLIRMDAIAYLWKRLGTSCVHLPETHAMVKLFRAALDAAAPWVAIITETNVPHQDNISYFGEAGDEATMVYNFSLPPLAAHAILRGDAGVLSRWAASLKTPAAGNTFFNFTASHDGIGVTPAKGLLPPREIDFLVATTIANGGHVSTKRESDGGDSPYELNITYFDLLGGGGEGDEAVARFMLSQALMLAMPGVPGIYFHSLLGSRNHAAGVAATGRHRSINREKFQRSQLEGELANPSSRRSKVLKLYRRLLEARKSSPAFNPMATAEFPAWDKRLFVVLRQHHGQSLVAIHNVSNSTVELDYSLVADKLNGQTPRDLLGGAEFAPAQSLLVPPYSALWLAAGR